MEDGDPNNIKDRSTVNESAGTREPDPDSAVGHTENQFPLHSSVLEDQRRQNGGKEGTASNTEELGKAMEAETRTSTPGTM